MRPSGLACSLLLATLPATLIAQSPRTLEFGVTAGASHHDFRYRYPGEQDWESDVGVRFDLRLVPTRIGTLGFAAHVNLFDYAIFGNQCVQDCGVPQPATQNGSAISVPVHEPWRVTRYGLGVTLDRALRKGIHGQLGILGGTTSRTAQAAQTRPSDATYDRYEWFVGGEAGLAYRWRDLAIGASAEYGRVPRTELALRPNYARAGVRVAYTVPLR
jgi:hypothetical protein